MAPIKYELPKIEELKFSSLNNSSLETYGNRIDELRLFVEFPEIKAKFNFDKEKFSGIWYEQYQTSNIIETKIDS